MTASTPIAIDQLPPCDVLREIMSRRLVILPDGTEKKLVANISVACARALYELVLREKPALVVEIGMAQGVSSLAILCALQQTGGRLISVDPYINWESGRLAAVNNIERAGYTPLHRHIKAKSYEALPQLIAEGAKPNLGYIDGAHDFPNAFIDFFYLDVMLPAGGVIGFNDAGWADVYKVIQLLRSRWHYQELDVGLRPDYRGRNMMVTLARRVLNRSRHDRYFRKLAHYNV